MINFTLFEGFDYTKLPYDDFVDTLYDTGCQVHDLGESTLPGKHIYGLSIGDLNTKPVIYIEGGIHGNHEWRNPYWIRYFAEIMSGKIKTPNEILITQLREYFSFFIIPSLNPYGYVTPDRGNANGVDLNRNFDYKWEESPEFNFNRSKGEYPFSEPETQIVKNVIETYKPILSIDIHTWGHNEGCTVHLSLANLKDWSQIRKIVNNADTLLGSDTYVAEPEPLSKSSDWFAQQPSIFGTNALGCILEVGGGYTEKEQARVGANYLFVYVLYVYEKLRNGRIEPY